MIINQSRTILETSFTMSSHVSLDQFWSNVDFLGPNWNWIQNVIAIFVNSDPHLYFLVLSIFHGCIYLALFKVGSKSYFEAQMRVW